MRTTLFLSTLFAVTLVGGAALAENPRGVSPTKAPSVVQRLRAKGDIVDKSYRASDRLPQGARDAASTAARAAAPVRVHFDRTSPLVNCSDSGVDCHAPRGAAQANGLAASADQTNRPAQAPAFLDKVLGKDRTNFNEADMDQGMNSRAVKRIWSSAAGRSAGAATGTVPLAQQKQNVRTQEQASSARMSCNEADQCSISNKEVKKVWAYDAIKKGVWKGPAEAAPSPADAAVARMKAEQAKKN